MKTVKAGVTVNGQMLNHLRFADDIDLIAESPEQLHEVRIKVNDNSKRLGIKINVSEN